MLYEVVNLFRDTQDPTDSEENKVIYKSGEPYPREGYNPPEKRIKELSSEHKKYKKVFIKEVQSEVDDAPKKLTEAEIKKMNKGPQEKLIEQLGGDPGEAKNEEERIALILNLQENEKPSPQK